MIGISEVVWLVTCALQWCSDSDILLLNRTNNTLIYSHSTSLFCIILRLERVHCVGEKRNSLKWVLFLKPFQCCSVSVYFFAKWCKENYKNYNVQCRLPWGNKEERKKLNLISSWMKFHPLFTLSLSIYSTYYVWKLLMSP